MLARSGGNDRKPADEIRIGYSVKETQSPFFVLARSGGKDRQPVGESARPQVNPSYLCCTHEASFSIRIHLLYRFGRDLPKQVDPSSLESGNDRPRSKCARIDLRDFHRRLPVTIQELVSSDIVDPPFPH